MDGQSQIIINGAGGLAAVKVRAITKVPCEDKDEDWELLYGAV